MRKTLTIAIGLMAISGAYASQPGAVYTLSNQVSGNRVLQFTRAANGTLSQSGSISTEGKGTGTGLGNQNALVFSEDKRYLFAVNAGSNSLSVFKTIGRNRNLELVEVEASVGRTPISVTQHGRFVFVLSAGDGQNPGGIRGYRQNSNGTLDAISGATAPLSAAAVGPAQIQFDKSGRSLVVTEKATNKIGIYAVGHAGLIQSWATNDSNGMTPFGFDIDRRGRVFIAEAFGGATDASALSSYRLLNNNSLDVITGSAATTETAACWTVLTEDGRFAFTTNAGSGSISGYRIDRSGSVSLLSQDGVSGTTGANSAPIDIAVAGKDRFLYVLGSGSHAIHSFRIANDGSLTSIDFDGCLPIGTNGLAAR